MNMELINDHIQYFNREIIESGFKRDIDDYVSSLPNNQNNIVTLRDIALKVLTVLDHIYHSDLPSALQNIILHNNQIPFTATAKPHNETLRQILENTEIELPEFFNQLNSCLAEIKSQLTENQAELKRVQEFIAPYLSKDIDQITEDGTATISIVFKDQQTITNLGQFTKAITAWNKTIPLYHQLLKSESPQDIQIVQVQNGSIDFLINLNVDVALNLVDLFELGFKLFAAYLTYKSIIKPIINTYHGNKELIREETKREPMLLGNIGKAIEIEINKQYNEAKKVDGKIDKAATKMKVKQVTRLITSHIVDGNDIKLLAWPKTDETQEGEETLENKKESLRKQSFAVRDELRHIPQKAKQKLLETYGKTEEVKEEKQKKTKEKKQKKAKKKKQKKTKNK